MKAGTLPYVEVPGDREDRIMARSGDCVGFDKTCAVWRFGFLPDSDAAKAYNVTITTDSVHEGFGYGFLWVIATRKTGKLTGRTFRGFAIELPPEFRRIIDSEA